MLKRPKATETVSAALALGPSAPRILYLGVDAMPWDATVNADGESAEQLVNAAYAYDFHRQVEALHRRVEAPTLNTGMRGGSKMQTEQPMAGQH